MKLPLNRWVCLFPIQGELTRSFPLVDFGIVLDEVSVSGIIAGLERYCFDRDYLIAAGAAARKNVLQNYSWAKTADRLLQGYLKMMKE